MFALAAFIVIVAANTRRFLIAMFAFALRSKAQFRRLTSTFADQQSEHRRKPDASKTNTREALGGSGFPGLQVIP